MYNKLYGRLCPEKYFEKDFQNNQRHLTNYSLSKDFYKIKSNIASNNLSVEESSSILFNRVGLKKLPPRSIILEEDLKN